MHGAFFFQQLHASVSFASIHLLSTLAAKLFNLFDVDDLAVSFLCVYAFDTHYSRLLHAS